MSPLAALLTRTYPELAKRLVPHAEKWRCAKCAAVEVRVFGLIRTSRFTAKRYGGRMAVAFFLCHACRSTPRAEIEDAIAEKLEDAPRARGFSLFTP
jgi:hypothetical protein